MNPIRDFFFNQSLAFIKAMLSKLFFYRSNKCQTQCVEPERLPWDLRSRTQYVIQKFSTRMTETNPEILAFSMQCFVAFFSCSNKSKIQLVEPETPSAGI